MSATCPYTSCFILSNPLRMSQDGRRRLNQGLVVALGFFSLDRACFCVIFSVYGCMLCLVR